MVFYIRGREALELVLELVLYERAEQLFLFAFIGGQNPRRGEQLVCEWEEPGLFSVRGQFLR